MFVEVAAFMCEVSVQQVQMKWSRTIVNAQIDKMIIISQSFTTAVNTQTLMDSWCV